MKVCSKCKIDKEYDEFNKRRNSKDGHRGDCKLCRKEYDKKYTINNKENIRKYGVKYRRENKQKELNRGKTYRENNREEINKRSREYYKNNLEKVRKRGRDYVNKTKKLTDYYLINLSQRTTYVYLLPDHNYVGITYRLEKRMAEHKLTHNRTTDNYILLETFDNRSDAIELETLLGDIGFNIGNPGGSKL